MGLTPSLLAAALVVPLPIAGLGSEGPVAADEVFGAGGLREAVATAMISLFWNLLRHFQTVQDCFHHRESRDST
jgi:hypothetical protein